MPSPPRDRPIAWSSPAFFGPGTVLMGAHDGAVEHRVLVVRIAGEVREDPLPHAGFCSAAEPPVEIDWLAEALRQIAPGDADTVAIQHRLDKQTVVGCGDADPAFPAWQPGLDPVPLVVAQSAAVGRSAPAKLTAYESKNPPRRNRLPSGGARFCRGCCILDSLPSPAG